MLRRAPLIGTTLIAAALSLSCAGTPALVGTQGASGTPLVWPEPPQAARIRFVQAISRPQDLGMRNTRWHRLLTWLVGGSSGEAFVRPTGVAADARALYVADPGAAALWLFDLQRKRCRRIQRAGQERLLSPVAVALGERQSVFLADSSLAKVFHIDLRGNCLRSIVLPAMRRPAGVAFDASRNRLYIADSAAHTIWVARADGTLIGSIGKRGTGSGEFNFPTHVAVDASGTLYVTDALGFRLQLFAPDGAFVSAFGRHGDSSGEFAMPKGVAVDAEGHIYVAEALFDAVQIFDRRGQFLLSFGGQGAQPGRFWLPNGIWIDLPDRIYVADAYNRRIQIFKYVANPNRS